MTDTTDNVANAHTDVAAAVLTTLDLAAPHAVSDDGRFFAVPVGTRLVDLMREAEKFAPHPARKVGTYTVRDAESFAWYVTRHATPWTEAWADLNRRAILAVIDGHAASAGNFGAGHGEHRVTLELRHTTAWKAWADLNGRMLPQEQFAEHVEARQAEVVEPRGADLLTIAQTIKQTKAADFESSKRLSDGQTVLVYREETKTSAGKSGEFEVPETITIAVAPFEGSDPFKVTARLRTRIDGGRLLIGYALDRADEVLEAAFRDVLTDVTDSLPDGVPVLAGWPS